MIRRDVTTSDGRNAWLLVPQIVHAELAGNLADAWQFVGIPPDLVGDLLTAIHRHDDGWADWDSRPEVDPQSGRPLAFDEMKLADSLAIWTRSIDLALCRQAIQGYFVAGHFTRLLRRFDSWRGDPAREELARKFLTEQEQNMVDCRRSRTATAAAGSDDVADAADRGVYYLQFFDAVSLWFCCAERREPRRIELPGGDGWTFSPVGSEQDCRLVRVEPWPLVSETCELSISGRVVPAARYYSAHEMLAVAAEETMEICWRLVR